MKEKLKLKEKFFEKSVKANTSNKPVSKKVVKVSWWNKVKKFIISLYPNLHKHMK